MSSIVIQGDTSGSITVEAPAVAGTNTLTLPASSGTLLTTTGDGSQLTGLPAGGKILQVLSVQKTDVFSTTSASLVDITGLTLTITPSSASSKILFMASIAGICTDNGVVQAYRDATIIAAGNASGSRTRSFTGSLWNGVFGAPSLMTASINWLDTPNTTSPVTYKIKAGAVGGGTLILGRNATNNNDVQHTLEHHK
jgi:hypothetical protein